MMDPYYYVVIALILQLFCIAIAGANSHEHFPKVLMYPRVEKAGSTFMRDILKQLAPRNRFPVIDDGNFYPSTEYLVKTMMGLKNGSVYINHCGFVSEDDYLKLSGRSDYARYVWINTARDPIDRQQSNFYYDIDVKARKFNKKLAIKEIEDRRRAGSCGCPDMEFEDCCIKLLKSSACSSNDLIFPKFGLNFWFSSNSIQGNKTAMLKELEHLQIIGLVDEMGIFLKYLEKILPFWFTGFANIHNMRHFATSSALILPGSNKTLTEEGALSNSVRATLKHHAAYQRDYFLFEHTRRLFWRKVMSVLSPKDLDL